MTQTDDVDFYDAKEKYISVIIYLKLLFVRSRQRSTSRTGPLDHIMIVPQDHIMIVP